MEKNVCGILDRIESMVCDYPPLPMFANRIMMLNADPESSITDICRVVEVEVSIVASILKLVNSPLYGLSRPVRSMSDAINLIGENELMNLVLANILFLEFKGIQQKKQYIAPLGYHSFKSAVTARYLGGRLNDDHEDLFLAGLLHDIGRNVIYYNLSEAVLQKVYGNPPAAGDVTGIEQTAFGTDHTVLGVRLLALWNFPVELQSAVRYHHRPHEAKEYPSYPLIIYLSDIFVDIIDGHQERAAAATDMAQSFLACLTEQDTCEIERLGLPLNHESLAEIFIDIEKELKKDEDLAELFA